MMSMPQGMHHDEVCFCECALNRERTSAISVSHSSGVRKPLKKVERGFQLSSSISPCQCACTKEGIVAIARVVCHDILRLESSLPTCL